MSTTKRQTDDETGVEIFTSSEGNKHITVDGHKLVKSEKYTENLWFVNDDQEGIKFTVWFDSVTREHITDGFKFRRNDHTVATLYDEEISREMKDVLIDYFL